MITEFSDRLVSVVHAHDAASILGEVEDLVGLDWSAVLWLEREFESTFLLDDEVGGSVLVAEGVTADDDGLFPGGDESWDVLNDDGLSEDSAVEDVSDCAVGGFPHLL